MQQYQQSYFELEPLVVVHKFRVLSTKMHWVETTDPNRPIVAGLWYMEHNHSEFSYFFFLLATLL